MDFKQEDLMLYNLIQSIKRLNPKPATIHCVSGRTEFFQKLMQSDFEVVHLDVDKVVIESERKLCSEAKHICFDVENWDYNVIPKESVEVLVFARSLHHMQNPGQAIQNTAQAITPHGVLLLSDFTQDQTGLWLMRQQVAFSSGCGFCGSEMWHHVGEDYERLGNLGLIDRKAVRRFFQEAGYKNFRIYYGKKSYSLFWRK